MKPVSGTRKPYNGSTRSLVLALDVGTTFSGVSYAILEPGEVPKIHGVTRFPGQEHVAGNSKIPSIMYYDQHGNMKAAGAEADGASVLAQAEDEGWIKTELFKLRLRPKTMTLKMNGMRLSPLPHNKSAVDVFGDFLSYLFRCTHSFIVDTHANGHSLWRAVEHDIQFVLSHPNGWEGAQQTKMRRAAIIGGLIPDSDEGKSRIRFVTEGEASLHACVLNGLAADVLSNPSGHGFLVADAGGGTLDISSYAIRGTTPLIIEEIAPPDCVFAGSVFVSRRARSFFAEKLKNSKYGTADSLDHITKRFDETTKRLFRDSKELQFVPFGSPLDKDLAVGIRGGQLRLLGVEVAALFEPSIESAITSIRSQIQASQGQVKSVWLVGGFAASPWLFSQLQERLAPLGVSVSRPDSQTSKAVADGAIGFYCDHHVSARVSKFMYGVEYLRTFDPEDEDHIARKHRLFELPSGPKLLPDAFDCILARGVKVKESTVFSRKYCTEVTNLSTLSVFEVEIWCYRGGDTIPKWIMRNADNFSTLCYVRADLSPLAGSASSKQGTGGKTYWTIVFSIEIHFGLTEFRARIKWNDKGEIKYGPASIVYNESGHRADEDDGGLADDDGTVSYSTSHSHASRQPSTSSSHAPSRSTSRAASVPQSTQSSHIDLPPVTSRSSRRTSSSSSRSPELDRHHSYTSRDVNLDGLTRESRRSSTITDKGKSRDRSGMPSAAQTPRPDRMTDRDRSVNVSTESRMSNATARLGETLTSIWGSAQSMAPSTRQTPLASPRGEAASYFEGTPGGLNLDFLSSQSASKAATPPAASKAASPPLASGVATPMPRAVEPEGLFDPDARVMSRASTAAPSKVPSAAPSKAPTAAPSRAPTAAPSRAPTAAPSRAPTAAPSKAPSLAPSKAPSAAPSKAPSAAVSRAPTAAPSKAPSPVSTPKVATPSETPKAANTPGATTPKASIAPSAGLSKAPSPIPSPRQAEAALPVSKAPTPPATSKAPSKAPTPAASKVPTPAASKAPTPAASKAPTPTAVSKAPSKAPTPKGPTPKSVSLAPSPRREPEPLPDVAPPTFAPVTQRSDDDAVIPPKPEEPYFAPADTSASNDWVKVDDKKNPADHGLGELWEGENKTAGFGDFLSSNANWSAPASATSTSKRNSAFGAAAGTGAGASPWGGLGSSFGAAASAAKAATGGGWGFGSSLGLGSLTNAFGIGSGSAEEETAAAPASVSSPTLPGGFGEEAASSKDLKLDLPPTTLEQKPSGPSTPITPGGSKQKRAAKKAEEAARKAEASAAEEAKQADEAQKQADEEAAAAAANAEEEAAEKKKAEEEAAKVAAEQVTAQTTETAAPPGPSAEVPSTPAAETPAEAPVPPANEGGASEAPPTENKDETLADVSPEIQAAAAEAKPDEAAERPKTPGAEDPQKDLDELLGDEDAAGEDAADEEKEDEDNAWGLPKKTKKGKNKNVSGAQDMSRTTSTASGGAGKKKKGKKK